MLKKMKQKIREWDGTIFEVEVSKDEYGNAVLKYPDGLTHTVTWRYYESIVAPASTLPN